MTDGKSFAIILIVVIVTAILGFAILPVINDSANEVGTVEGGTTTSTFTSTADFDAGTKAPTADGNLGIETNTDNLGIATGAFELGSLKGDAFNTADADANTAKWDLIASVGVETVTRSIAGGILNIDVEGLPGGGAAGVISAVGLSGDWDIRTKADQVVLTGTNDMARVNMLNENDEAFCGGLTVDGVFYDARKGTGANTWRTLAATCSNGIQSFIGAENDNLADPIWLRITKSGTTITWYFSSDGSAWTTDETTTFSTSATSFWTITDFDIADDGIATQIDFDAYHLASGGVSAGGFRTGGLWTSSSQSSSGTQAIVTLSYSGATAAGYIDFVALYDNDFNEIAFDGTNVVGGSSIEYTFVVTIPSGWRIRIGLAGDNSATATIQSAVVGVTSEDVVGGTTIADLALTVPLFVTLGIVIFIALILIGTVAAVLE